jgi:AcrR family transcriptional regulator
MARTQAERTAATRAKLTRAGRALFGTKGFAETSVEEVVREAKVTRGALYHQFDSKEALFAAVFEQVEQELVQASARAAARGTDALDRLRIGCRAFLEACLDPAVQRIVVLDAPAVLGWDRWKEIEERYALAVLRAGIDAAMDEGRLRRRPSEALAHLVLGALTEAAMVMARAPQRSPVRRQVVDEVDALFAALA